MKKHQSLTISFIIQSGLLIWKVKCFLIQTEENLDMAAKLKFIHFIFSILILFSDKNIVLKSFDKK